MSSNSESGISTAGVLLVAFIVLKLCKVIYWDWWWVLAPLWAPAILAIAGFIVFVFFKKDK